VQQGQHLYPAILFAFNQQAAVLLLPTGSWRGQSSFTCSFFTSLFCCHYCEENTLSLWQILFPFSQPDLPVRTLTLGSFNNAWLEHYATSRNVVGSIPDEVIGFFSWPNHSSRTTALRSTLLQTEISISNLPGGYGPKARKSDNLAAICEPIVYKT
jgi:hypothetical protein